MSKYYAMVPTGYVESLQQEGRRDKARAFLEYFLDMHNDSINSIRFYQKSWGLKSSSTVHVWIKDFKVEISKFFTYWELKNEQHYNSVKNQNEHQSNTNEIQNEQKKEEQSPIKSANLEQQSNTNEIQNEQQSNKDTKNTNSNNINADSNESTKRKKSKSEYDTNFELAWNEYDKRNADNKRVGNKKRAQSIYFKRFKNMDIKYILEAIKEYKTSLDEWRDMKDFDGFLNGMIDIYLPRRAWVITTSNEKLLGYYYESKDMFVFDSGGERPINKEKMKELLNNKKIGYVA